MSNAFKSPRLYHRDEIIAFIHAAQRDVSNYTAIMVFNDICGSGTFATCNGHFGILTAHHVSKQIFKERNTKVRLVIAAHGHDLFFNSDTAQEVLVGRCNPATELQGPDLSFIILRDQTLLATIQSKKSFYNLDAWRQSYLSEPDYYKEFKWLLAGCPFESWEHVTEGPEEGATRVANLVLEAGFETHQTRDNFDYLEFNVDSGANNYPEKYQGMSGGGMWLMPLVADGDATDKSKVAPDIFLSGVAFHSRPKEANQQIITGHGWNSIYVNVKEALKNINR